MNYGGCIYIIKNQYNTVLYTGITSQLSAGIWEYKTKFYPKSFTSKYNRSKIVWYESFQELKRQLTVKNESKVDAGKIMKH